MTTRRDFLFRSAVGLAGLVINPWGISAFAAPETSGTLAIHQGWTTESETEIKVSRTKAKRYTYEVVSSTGKGLKVLILNEFSFSATSPYVVDHLHVGGLKLGEKYQLWVFDEDDVLDIREFYALDLNKRSAKIAVFSCMQDFNWKAQKLMWPAVAQSQPDIMFLIGDACYADYFADHNADGVWRRHMETRNSVDLYRFRRLIPLIAVWDDHDFGMNDGDGSLSYKADSLRIFDGLFGCFSKDRHSQGPGCARFVYAFGLRLALMDDRYFRTTPLASDETLWGKEQEDLLHEHLGKSTLPTLIFNGIQYFGGHPKEESYELCQPKAFARTLERLATVESPILFCSGDVHFSEIRTLEPKPLGYQTWELTSSSIHSYDFLWEANSTNGGPPRECMEWRNNFLLVKTQTDPSHPDRMDFVVDCIGSDELSFTFAQKLVRG